MSNTPRHDKDTNPDPITGAPGSHPVGTGIGAASAGAAGTAIGMAVGGPVGAAVGAVIGSVAGGYAGKGAAEAIDPTAEDAYWREAHGKQSFAERDYTYDDYAPAYRTGYNSYAAHRAAGRDFASAEGDLQQSYVRDRGTSRLEWEKAKHATKAAWHRLENRVERAIPGDSDHDGK